MVRSLSLSSSIPTINLQALYPSHLLSLSLSTSPKKSALFNFQSLLLVILLIICTCTYVRATAPSLVDRNKNGSVFFFFSSHASNKMMTFSPSVHHLLFLFFGFEMKKKKVPWACFGNLLESVSLCFLDLYFLILLLLLLFFLCEETRNL